MDETKLETLSDEVGYGSIVRRQIRVVADAMGDVLTRIDLTELGLRVQGLRSLLKPYTSDEIQEAIRGIQQESKEKSGDLRVISYQRSVRIFETLLDVAKKAGFLKE